MPTSTGVRETATYIRPDGLAGVEALQADFVTHAYRRHSHPTWTVAMMDRGAARFELDDSEQVACHGELFILEPDAVHTGVPAVPGGWAYKVLYLDPVHIGVWTDDGVLPRATRRVVFQDASLRAALASAHRALAERSTELAVDMAVLAAVTALGPHLRPEPPPTRTRPEHAAVRRAQTHLQEHWAETVTLAELAERARLSPFELARTFRAQVGLPPHAYQLDLRIARARELLAQGEPAAQVAATCGFCDQAHLTRVFRRAVGVSPGRYVLAARSSKTVMRS